MLLLRWIASSENIKNVKDVEKRTEIRKRKKVCSNCFGNHRVAEFNRNLNDDSAERDIPQAYI